VELAIFIFRWLYQE